jgi:hypothetical protein
MEDDGDNSFIEIFVCLVQYGASQSRIGLSKNPTEKIKRAIKKNPTTSVTLLLTVGPFQTEQEALWFQSEWSRGVSGINAKVERGRKLANRAHIPILSM